MSDKNSLPFELTSQSISEWLKQFKSSDILVMSNEIYKVLSILKNEQKKIDSVALAFVVMRLTPVVMHLTAALEKAICKPPLRSKIAQVSMRMLRNMAFLHAYLARQLDHQSDQALHANYALQIVAVVLKHSALCYDRPPTILWECVSKCYELALQKDFLERAVKYPLTEFQALPTLSLALKRLLLFSLATPYKYSQKDILSLFDFCTQNSHFIHFVHQGISLNHVFCWDYTATNSYQPVYSRPEKLPDHCVLFHTNALIHAEQKKALTIAGADLLIARFNQYRDLLESTKFALSKPYVFAGSFEQVVGFFVKHMRLQKILRINTPIPKDLNFSSLELVKEKEKKEIELEKVASADIWNHKKEEKELIKLKFGAMKLVQTAQSLFFAAETMEVKLVLGDIFICYDSSLKPVLGITRHVELKQRSVIQKSVIELCRGHVSLLQQTHSAAKLMAVLLENESRYELFLAPGEYTTGSVLKFDQVEVVLERMCELSPTFLRYVVSVRELSV